MQTGYHVTGRKFIDKKAEVAEHDVIFFQLYCTRAKAFEMFFGSSQLYLGNDCRGQVLQDSVKATNGILFTTLIE